MKYFLLALLLLGSSNAFACEQKCMPILEIYGSLEQQIEEIGKKYPTIQQMIAISKMTGENIANLGAASAPEFKSYQAEVQEAVLAWGKQMAAIWPGPWSENNQVMLKMFDGALQRCQRTCY